MLLVLFYLFFVRQSPVLFLNTHELQTETSDYLPVYAHQQVVRYRRPATWPSKNVNITKVFNREELIKEQNTRTRLINMT